MWKSKSACWTFLFSDFAFTFCSSNAEHLCSFSFSYLCSWCPICLEYNSFSYSCWTSFQPLKLCTNVSFSRSVPYFCSGSVRCPYSGPHMFIMHLLYNDAYYIICMFIFTTILHVLWRQRICLILWVVGFLPVDDSLKTLSTCLYNEWTKMPLWMDGECLVLPLAHRWCEINGSHYC